MAQKNVSPWAPVVAEAIEGRIGEGCRVVDAPGGNTLGRTPYHVRTLAEGAVQ